MKREDNTYIARNSQINFGVNKWLSHKTICETYCENNTLSGPIDLHCTNEPEFKEWFSWN